MSPTTVFTAEGTRPAHKPTSRNAVLESNQRPWNDGFGTVGGATDV